MTVDGATIVYLLRFLSPVPLKYADVVSLDGSTVGAFLGFLGIVASTIGGVYVATRNSRSEKASVALQTLEATRDKTQEKQLQQRDEEIAYEKRKLADCQTDARLREEELEAEIDQLKIEVSRLRGLLAVKESHDG